MKKWTTSLRRLIFLAATAAKGILKTVTGNPIHITDALAKPVQALSISLEPIQDLHGYDNPWPAGGGKNKFDAEFIQGSAIGLGVTTRVVSKNTIPISQGHTYTFSASDYSVFSFVLNSSPTSSLPFDSQHYDYCGTSVQWTTEPITFTATHDGYVAIVAKRINETSIIPSDVSSLNMQFEESASPTIFAPYSNICPIYGHTDADVTRTGKNLFDPTYRSNLTANIRFYYNTTGFLLKANTAYTFSVSSPSAQNTILEIGGSQLTANYGKTSITYTPTQDVYVWFDAYYAGNYPVPSGGTAAVNCQLELGSTASAYSPYIGTTYPIPIGQTVYGGTLDVLTGVLTVDRVMDTFTKDSVWYSFTTGTGNSSAVVQLSEYLNCKFVTGISSYNGAISSTGKEAPNYWVNPRQDEALASLGDMYFAYSNIVQLRFHRADVANITDLASFKANFPDTQIVYFLATPAIIQLTPQQVELLLGENNIWSDGTMTLVYLADGNASEIEALNILLGNRYVNNHEADEPTDREALDILLGR